MPRVNAPQQADQKAQSFKNRLDDDTIYGPVPVDKKALLSPRYRVGVELARSFYYLVQNEG